MTLERICVIGLGRLGAPLAACFADRGFSTIGVDCDPLRLDSLVSCTPPGYEPGLRERLARGRERLTLTTDSAAAIVKSDVSFVVVPTPSDSDGTFSLKHVLSAVEGIGAGLRQTSSFHLVVIVSTVMPGATAEDIAPALERASGKRAGVDFGLCYSPEFVALGRVVNDLLNPDFVLIGESDPESGQKLAALYERFCETVPQVARMSIVNAELTKLAINGYLTTKISFANALARLCERLPGANVDVVTGAMGLDSRIGPKYLTGAIAFGGPCFPRDNAALAVCAERAGASSTLPRATDAFNTEQGIWLTDFVRGFTSPGGRVAVLGLAYKPDTDVTEQSPGLLLARALQACGVQVTAYDPAVSECPGLDLAPSVRVCVEAADVVVIATPWPEFKRLAASDCMPDRRPRTIIDCWRIAGHLSMIDGLQYVQLGTGMATGAPC